MNPGDYRREYAAYCAALARAQYDQHTGRAPHTQLDLLRERYADLWTPDNIAALERARRDTPAQFETERAALRRLLYAARLGYTSERARETTNELLRCETAQRIAWAGARVAADDVPDLLAHEPDAARRRELAARWFETLRACDDLRAARLAVLDESADELDCASYLALLHAAAQADETSLTNAAGALLTRTSESYHAHLRAWATRQLPPQYARTPDYADSLVFARLAHLDRFFATSELPATYRATCAALGIRVEQQPNLRVECETNATRTVAAACIALAPPDDVRLVAGTQGGAQLFRAFLRAAGHAQQLAWVSSTTAARYPEFIYGPDDTTRAAYGFLFQYLLHDPAWLGAQRGLKVTDAIASARDFALLELHDVRRCCAQLQHQAQLAAAPDTRAENLAAEYAAQQTEATGFSYDPALHLRDASDSMNTTAATLRARLFAAALGEYLRTRHGRRWWATRAAADELIDLWNTGARYTVEELATMTGAGALDVELLADSLLAAVNEE